MKLEELMIGDWVYVKDYPMKPIPTKIKPEHFIRSLVAFEPIPLTPEILEKNGFEYNPFSTGFYECKTEEGNIACTKTDYWLFYINDNIIPNHFHYIHELQHALKLCGIKKTIEL